MPDMFDGVTEGLSDKSLLFKFGIFILIILFISFVIFLIVLLANIIFPPMQQIIPFENTSLGIRLSASGG